MELQQIDPELEAFEKLKVREVRTEGHDTAAAFLAKFQSTAANLQPDERIKLVYTHESMESLKAVLADPQANKICSLQWTYYGKEDVTPIIPLLVNSCPELASLRVDFWYYSAFDFVSSMLERPSNKLKVLEMPWSAKGDSARLFAALGQSQVSVLGLYSGASSEFAQGLYEYLARDLLVRLKVWDCNQVPSEMMMSLVDCTRLVKLELIECEFSESTAFTLPKSITKLELRHCRFVGGFDWSFLTGSNVQELDMYRVRSVDGKQLGDALAVHLRAKGLDKLRLVFCDFVDETLAAVGVEIGRIKRFDIGSHLNDASIKLIALALQSPNSEMKELVLPYDGNTVRSIEDYLVPVLKHPNCNLVKLNFWAFGPEYKEAARRVNYTFRNRIALFVLLQGKQVRRIYCPLRRLPVEMFRLVGQMLN
ncbi:hypothetical protein BASA81_000590 [Batrachochytrium salamandrivorans]|nr:hypothetical protein BASA81_000590 [Batrachochytrium salamandrivorans]